MNDRKYRATRSRDIERRQKRRVRSRRRKKRKNPILWVIILLIAFIVMMFGVILIQRYSSSDERADLNVYYGINREDDLAVIVDNQVIGKAESGLYSAGGRMIDGYPYIEYSVLTQFINKRFYWDFYENQLLYTLPEGTVYVPEGSSEYTEVQEQRSENYVIFEVEDEKAYISLDFIAKYTNIDYVLNSEPNRVMVVTDFGESMVGTVKKDTQVRFQGGVKSPILTQVEKGQEVTVLEDEDEWKKVRTKDGFIGYIKTNTLKDVRSRIVDRADIEPVYTNISKDYTINMAWHNIGNEAANSYLSDMLTSVKGLNTIAPTWFHIADTEGNLVSIADADYVSQAHAANLEVWATLRDFHGGISSAEEIYEVLSYTSKRERLIQQVIEASIQSNIDGINLDFELITEECAKHYLQFVRELSVQCRLNHLVFSIDNYVPMSYNQYYDLEEQAAVADYVVIMAYDEHTDGSLEAGSVASYNYVRDGIENALLSVPKEKLIGAVPFYSRLWFEDGSGLSSRSIGMDESVQEVQQAGAQVVWDEVTKQNYAQWEADGGKYQIWLEDRESISEKLSVMSNHQLAGVAAWCLGWENSDIWDIISQYMN